MKNIWQALRTRAEILELGGLYVDMRLPADIGDHAAVDCHLQST